MKHGEIMRAAREQTPVRVRFQGFDMPAYIVSEDVRRLLAPELKMPAGVCSHRLFGTWSTGMNRRHRVYMAAVMMDVGEVPTWKPMFVKARHVSRAPSSYAGYYHARYLMA